ncbi:MAG TPA: hypothetical protein VFC44_05555 [Candidatus Saccharimonadales bacterium]|nr:hypothetical protein [Candidatus Saccharimonadales bacterium]
MGQAPKEWVDMYPAGKIEVPPNFLPEHPFDLGDFHSLDEQLAPFPRTPHDAQVHRQEQSQVRANGLRTTTPA